MTSSVSLICSDSGTANRVEVTTSFSPKVIWVGASIRPSTPEASCVSTASDWRRNASTGGIGRLRTNSASESMYSGLAAYVSGVKHQGNTLPLAVLSPLAGRLTGRYGPRPLMLAGAAVAGIGQLCLLLITPATSYPVLVPALAGVGIGVGIFTAPVVATAIRAVPPDRSGLASGINNTARQAGSALGVAIFGAVAGSPAHAGHFIAAMRGLGIAAALGWLAVIALTAVSVKPASGQRG
jgi:DHA2 family methylenomycin A resistance protein-like MFS transporter